MFLSGVVLCVVLCCFYVVKWFVVGVVFVLMCSCVVWCSVVFLLLFVVACVVFVSL